MSTDMPSTTKPTDEHSDAERNRMLADANKEFHDIAQEQRERRNIQKHQKYQE